MAAKYVATQRTGNHSINITIQVYEMNFNVDGLPRILFHRQQLFSKFYDSSQM